MKRKALALLLAAFLLLSVSALAVSGEAAAVKAGTYTDGTNTLVMAADGSFTMTKGGENMDGTAFQLTVTGIYAEGKFTLTGLFDGDMDLTDLASEDQIAADIATAESLYSSAASGEASGEASDEPGLVPGTYTDGENTMIVAEDGSFTLTTAGENMDGAGFSLTVVGTVAEDGTIAITGVFDGELDLTDLASEEQLAGNLATAQALYQPVSASGEPSGEASGEAGEGTYTDGENTLVLAADGSFVMTTAGENSDGAGVNITVNGTFIDGVVTIVSVFDGELDVTSMAADYQLEGNRTTAEALLGL